MKNLKLLISITLLFGIVVFTSSCKKDEQETPENTSVSADDALAESLFDDVTNIANEAYERGAGGLKSSDLGYFLSGCATVTLDTTVMPRVLTIDFGDVNCLCQDGRYRRGKIIVTFNGRYWWPGTVITYGFDNYFVDDNQLDGTKVVTNMGFNDDFHLYWDIQVVGVINLANGGTLSWNASKEREWEAGYQTNTPFDDVYLITGSSNGIRPSGETWTKVIVNPLRIEIGCRWIVSGTMEVTPEGLSTRVVDWGNGDCDNIITVMVNGNTYTVFLP